MAHLSPARRVALGALSERRRRGAHMRELLRASADMEALDARDRALASRLALGAVGAEGMLDELLAAHVRRLSSLEPRVRDALRLAVYEVCCLGVEPSVAVSQGVELVRSVRPRAAGMANAVLRRVADEDRPRVVAARARAAEGAADVDELALASGLPAWLLARVAQDRGTPVACALALAQAEPAPVYVAEGPALAGTGEVASLLESAGLGPTPCALPGSHRLATAAGLSASGLVDGARVVVADLSAQVVARVVAPRPGERVLEVGQGRGTKTLLMQAAAGSMGGLAQVVGVDSEAFKARVAARRMEAVGLQDHVSCLACDARELARPHAEGVPDEPFDLVFVDAPCSGVGTMRRHPEIPWALAEDAVAPGGPLPSLQLQILGAAASRVAPGGTLAYATCSVIAEEDERVVEAFLASEAGCAFAPASAMGRPGVATLPPEARELVSQAVTKEGWLLTSPQAGGPDGHFCALLTRTR